MIFKGIRDCQYNCKHIDNFREQVAQGMLQLKLVEELTKPAGLTTIEDVFRIIQSRSNFEVSLNPLILTQYLIVNGSFKQTGVVVGIGRIKTKDKNIA